MPGVTRVAAFDCGTNSLRLLVADVSLDPPRLVDVDRRTEFVRLGQGVDATGRFAPQALERALRVTRTYAAVCREAGVERARFVATSATRDAADRHVFVDAVREIVGVEPEVVDGAQEAALSFVGATRGLAEGEGVVVVDLGGGSTEVVLGSGGTVEAALSVDVGSVRLTERRLVQDPPSPDQVAAAARDVEQALDAVAAAVPLHRCRTLVGVAGTVATVTAHALRLPGWARDGVHGAVLPLEQVVAACEDLMHLRRAERAALPYLHPGRVDVIGAGALIWAHVLRSVHAASGVDAVTTSEHDILDGIAWSLA